jgi:hypothetical protein
MKQVYVSVLHQVVRQLLKTTEKYIHDFVSVNKYQFDTINSYNIELTFVLIYLYDGVMYICILNNIRKEKHESNRAQLTHTQTKIALI